MKLFFLAGSLLTPTFAMAGLFGPSNFNDCVLEGLKTAKTEFAIKALYSTCASKFPSKESTATPSVTPEEARRLSLIKKCRLTESEDRGETGTFLVKDFPTLSSAVLKLTSQKLAQGKGAYSDSDTISFQNNNSFGISGVALGLGLRKGLGSCSWRSEDYKAVIYCNSYSVNSGVAADSYGSISCPNSTRDFPKENYCIVGVRPAYDRISQGLASAMVRMELCN